MNMIVCVKSASLHGISVRIVGGALCLGRQYVFSVLANNTSEH